MPLSISLPLVACRFSAEEVYEQRHNTNTLLQVRSPRSNASLARTACFHKRLINKHWKQTHLLLRACRPLAFQPAQFSRQPLICAHLVCHSCLLQPLDLSLVVGYIMKGFCVNLKYSISSGTSVSFRRMYFRREDRT